MPIDTKYAPYARETAACVDLAYEAMEDDIEAELQGATGAARDALTRILFKLRGRRKVLAEFTDLTKDNA